jgi:hypothetical protein
MNNFFKYVIHFIYLNSIKNNFFSFLNIFIAKIENLFRKRKHNSISKVKHRNRINSLSNRSLIFHLI